MLGLLVVLPNSRPLPSCPRNAALSRNPRNAQARSTIPPCHPPPRRSAAPLSRPEPL
jgi:hypothetical protein